MSQKTTALSALTATYSDSEDEHSDSDNNDSLEEEREEKTSPDGLVQPPKNTPLLADRFADSRGNSPAGALSVEALKTDKRWSIDIEEIDDMPTVDRPTSPTAFHKSLVGLHPSAIAIPPEPAERCSRQLQDKISRLHEKMKAGYDMINMIQKRKDFRNPSIYEKLIAYCGIDELGTNFQKEVYDPKKFGEESFYDELAKRQKEEMERKERERKQKASGSTKVEFLTGTAKKMGQAGDGNGSKKKTKWDMPVGGQIATSLQKKL